MSLTLDPIDTRRRIHELAWGGFHRFEDISWLIEDEHLESDALGEEDRRWIELNVAEEVALKLAAEQSWPPATEYDRLEKVFVELRKVGFVALHRAGNTRGEGLEDVRQQFQEAGGIDSGINAFCFYHAQDVDAVVTSGRLFLAFGAIGKASDGQREEKNRAVGRRIVELAGAALPTTWNGDVGERITVNVGQWRKRSPAT